MISSSTSDEMNETTYCMQHAACCIPLQRDGNGKRTGSLGVADETGRAHKSKFAFVFNT
jgi:hypothetical protein